MKVFVLGLVATVPGIRSFSFYSSTITSSPLSPVSFVNKLVNNLNGDTAKPPSTSNPKTLTPVSLQPSTTTKTKPSQPVRHTPPTTIRRPIVAGNWKLNPTTLDEAVTLLNGLKDSSSSSTADVVIFPPLPYLSIALEILKDTPIQIGAQNAGIYEKGAFTGEIAPSMLSSSGISHVLLGHSERRTLFGETDVNINQRLQKCLLEEGLTVVLCVGETLEEYEAGLLTSVVDTQLRKGLMNVSNESLMTGRIVVAYEPVWAIGTGLVATPQQAQDAHVAIRRTLESVYDAGVAQAVRIQYGGSVSPESVGDLMDMPDIDGALVGGASLLSDSFGKIIQGASPDGNTAATAAPVPPVVTIDPTTFHHEPLSTFAVPNLKPKGPRKGADVGTPHDSSRPFTKVDTLSSGAWWCAEGGWPSPSPRATTEVFYVLEGHACVTDADGKRNFMGPGDLVVLPKGWSGRWDVLEDIHKIWFVADHPDVTDDDQNCNAIVKKYNDFTMEQLTNSNSGGQASDASEASQTYLDNGYVGVGCKSYPPGSFEISDNVITNTQGIHVLEGTFFLTNEDGSARRCSAGDTVVLPKGWTGYWDVITPMKQLWVVA